MYCTIFILYEINIRKKRLKIQNSYKMKSICLHKLCSKFEVDIIKMVHMQFCLGVIPKTATGCHPNSIESFYAFQAQIYQFLSQYYIYKKNTK